MKYKNLMTVVAASLLSTAVLGGCSSDDTSTDDTAGTEVSYWESQETDILAGNSFQTIATSGKMELQLNPKAATLRWLDTETGKYQDTNMSGNTEFSGNNNSKSDLIVNFYNGTNTDLYKTYTNYDSYSMSAKFNQVGYQLIENGVRAIYTLGEDSITYKNFPPNISGERMEEFVLQHLDSKKAELLTKNYYTKLADGSYQRKSNEDSPLGSMAVKELYDYFYETGTYNEEELYADIDAYAKSTEEDYPSSLMIRMAVEYTLEDNQLVVNLDASKIETTAANPIRNIQLLPYFLTSSLDAEEEGYMFIPDGSGALMYLDSTKSTEYQYSAHFYRDDKLVDADIYTSISPSLTMPVIGMKTENSTILGVIENGAEVATLDGYIRNKDNSEPFAKMKLTFDIREQQVMTTASGNSFQVYKATDDIYDGLITMRYFWLDEDADYVDMANCYADYLIEKGVLAEQEAEAEAPLFVDVVGVTDKTQYFLGIPYEGNQVLTSFSEAKEILTDLNSEGISNVKMIYSGMLNGGMNQRGLADGISFGSDLGGSKEFKNLVSYAESIGADVYPNLLLQSLYTKKGINADDMAFNIVNARAQLYQFDPVQVIPDETVDYKQYIVSPNYIAEYLEEVKSSYSKKIGLDTVASSDLMTYLGTNYKGTQVSLGTADEIYNEAAAEFAEGMSLMLSNPLADAYAYASVLTDMPTEDSSLRALDASIPFMQIVLEGNKTYSTESVNLESTDIQENFMRAIESKSALKFTFTYRDSALLAGTMQNDLFAVDYNTWKDEIGTYYAEYQEFYEAVKDAEIEEHELYERDEDLRVVTYSNGVKIYFNYSNQDAQIDGVKVPALSYKIEK